MPILGSLTGSQGFGRSGGGSGISSQYFSAEGFNLISGTAQQYDAYYEKVYSTPGTYTFKHPPVDSEAYILIAGGGGGGGAYHAGGGGAGGVVYGKVNLSADGTTTVTVGSKGRGGIRDGNGSNDGEQGGDSSAFGYTAKGGGYGRWRCTSVDGGCAGGGGHHAATHCGQSERVGLSNQPAYSGMYTFPANGSASGGHGQNGHGAGGGGGAGGPGELSIYPGRNGSGGPGVLLMGRFLAGGGSAGAHNGQGNHVLPPLGGGGGQGRTEQVPGDNATSHGSGGGGGGHTTGGHGGNGSDGVVIIRIHAVKEIGTKIDSTYFANNSFTLISGTAGTAAATYRRNFTATGSFTFTAPPVNCTARVILVGGGGSSASAHAGGGGGGGVVVGNYALTAGQTINGSIGAGGPACTSCYYGGASAGQDSTFGVWTAKGGGSGDGTNSSGSGGDGGSGGGGGPSSGAPGSGHVAGGNASQPGINNPGAIYNLGHAGGYGNLRYDGQQGLQGSHGSGGGGGAGSRGHWSNSYPSGSTGNTHSKGNGDGGRGYYSPFLNTHWGGGGGGGGHNGWAWNGGGVGGAGGGGNGGPESTQGQAGAANTGGGAGGTGHSLTNGTAGGSGVCIIMLRADGDASRIPE